MITDTIKDEDIIMMDDMQKDPVFCYVLSKDFDKSFCWYGKNGTLIVINFSQLMDEEININEVITSLQLQYLTVHELSHWATTEEEVEGEWVKFLIKEIMYSY